jgi:hypothetical protein
MEMLKHPTLVGQWVLVSFNLQLLLVLEISPLDQLLMEKLSDHQVCAAF